MELLSARFYLAIGQFGRGPEESLYSYETPVEVPFTRVTATSEPATLALLGTGLLVLGGIARTRRRA